MGDYSAAIELEPRWALAYYRRGRVHNMLGDYGIALGDFSEAIDIDVSYSAAYYGRGVVYCNLNKDDHTRAMPDLARATEADGGNNLTYFAYGMAHFQVGHNELLIDDFSQVYDDLALDDFSQIVDNLGKMTKPQRIDYVGAYMLRGEVYYRLGEYDSALADFREVIEYDVREDETKSYETEMAYRFCGALHRKRGEYEAALAAYAKALECRQEYDFATRFERGRTYLDMENYDLAVADYSEASEIVLKGVARYTGYDRLLIPGRLKRAKAELAEAAELASERGMVDDVFRGYLRDVDACIKVHWNEQR